MIVPRFKLRQLYAFAHLSKIEPEAFKHVQLFSKVKVLYPAIDRLGIFNE